MFSVQLHYSNRYLHFFITVFQQSHPVFAWVPLIFFRPPKSKPIKFWGWAHEPGTGKQCWIQQLVKCQQSNLPIIHFGMSKTQGAMSLIFDQVMDNTKDCTHSLKHFEMQRPRLSLDVFWYHIVESLNLGEATQMEAARLVWKLSTRNFKISKNLLYKLLAVCLMLAEKIHEDSINNLLTFSIVSGVSKKDLKSLELEALELLDFNLNLSPQERQVLPDCLKQ